MILKILLGGIAKKAYLVFLLPQAILHAQGGSGPLIDGLSTACSSITSLLPPLAMLLITMSGIVYALGQATPSQERAKAAAWAGILISGATICMLIALIGPIVLNSIYGCQIDCGGGGVLVGYGGC